MGSERSEQVRRAVRELPVRYREVVVLRYLEGMDAEGTARVLGLSRNAMEVRLHRAKRRLREMLGAWVEEGE
jgi:RNA polymerase sigma-70 factor (ECF subfamily)